MGLLRAGIGAAASAISDQWREYFYCDSLPANVLMTKGQKRGGGGGSENIISNGSIIAVNEGQCMMVVQQGEIIEFCAEAGEFVFDSGTEPSIFYGELGEGIKQTFARIGRRISFGGSTANDQRVYFFNTKELMGNKWGTPAPVPFRVVDMNIGLDTDIAVRCNGEFSYRISDPLLFYKNVCANVTSTFTRDKIDGQLKSEFLTALQTGLGLLSDLGIRYSAIPAHAMELSNAMNDVLSVSWTQKRGISIVAVGMNSIITSPEDEERIKELQRMAVLRDPNMRAAYGAQSQGEALKTAAGNEAGAMMGIMGMNMAGAAAGAMGATGLYDPNQPYQPHNAYNVATGGGFATQPQPMQQPATAGWTCPNGHTNPDSAKFCQECGAPKPAPVGTWTCPNCGATNSGKFCQECGTPKPAATWTCPNGHENPASSKFCQECGSPRP